MAKTWQTAWLFACWDVSKRHVVDGDGSALYDPRPLVSRWLHASQLGIRCIVLGLVGAGAVLAAPCPGWSAGQPGPADSTAGPASVPSAEVTFDVPRRFAAVMEPLTECQRLYGVGDILPAPKGSGGEYQIKQIEERRLQLSSLRGRRAIWIAVGGVIPERPGWRVIGTPILRM